jgi:formylglycine-generating enzyme required for sulfatase activity
MKFAILLLLTAFAFSFKSFRPFTPPGCVRITQTYFADSHEVTNQSWKEYEYWVRELYGPFSVEHRSVLPDSSALAGLPAGYYTSPRFHRHPVAGISHQQAVKFCEWRTSRVRAMYRKRYGHDIALHYRLPSEQEWQELYDVLYISSPSNGGPRFNCRDSSQTGSGPLPAGSFPSNTNGLYDMAGNIAEMLREPGISKGGSWLHSADSCRGGRRILYTGPAAWLGFRCVCEVELR